MYKVPPELLAANTPKAPVPIAAITPAGPSVAKYTANAPATIATVVSCAHVIRWESFDKISHPSAVVPREYGVMEFSIFKRKER